MTIRNCTYYFLFLFLVVANISLKAQNVATRTDRNQILIGERIEYELLIFLPDPGYKIYFDLPDSILHFDAIDKGSFDSTANDNGFNLRRKIIFTSFDSGAWYIPAFPVTLEKGNDAKRFMTDSVLINVGYAQSDSTAELRDIKPIMEVKVIDYFWYYVGGAILISLIIAILLLRYFRRRARKPLPVLHSDLSPFDEAMNDLNTLSKYSLHIPNEVKQYHTQLDYIFKRYYSRKIEINLLNKTTDELLLKSNELQEETALISVLAETLRMGDAVKFAKYVPPVSESENAMLQIREAIEKLEKNKTIKT
jgi:hypothetical protein